jgi:hypothetical protein
MDIVEGIFCPLRCRVHHGSGWAEFPVTIEKEFMKCFIRVSLLVFSMSAMADIEHKPGMEGHPSQQKLSIARTCFKEIDNKGCGHPRDDQEFFISCLDETRDELTLSCQSFFQKLYGKKK